MANVSSKIGMNMGEKGVSETERGDGGVSKSRDSTHTVYYCKMHHQSLGKMAQLSLLCIILRNLHT